MEKKKEVAVHKQEITKLPCYCRSWKFRWDMAVEIHVKFSFNNSHMETITANIMRLCQGHRFELFQHSFEEVMMFCQFGSPSAWVKHVANSECYCSYEQSVMRSCLHTRTHTGLRACACCTLTLTRFTWYKYIIKIKRQNSSVTLIETQLSFYGS